MKKVLIPFFGCLLVFTLLLGSFGSAKAEIGDDPVVTPVSGDMEFTTEVVPIASLPGTIELADLMLAPAGFPEGEAQFEGAGVLVTKFDAGKATACFTISGTQWGWGGKVGMWDGAKWVMLPTTIKTTGDDGTSTTACATITGNGTYAFIKYVTDATLLPTCTQDLEWFYMSMGNTGYYGVGLNFTGSTKPAAGQPFTWEIVNQNPANLFTPTSGSGYIVNKGIILAEVLGLHSSIIFPNAFTYTIRIYTPECHILFLKYDRR